MAKREHPEDLDKSSAVHGELASTNALALLTLKVKYDAGEFRNFVHNPYAFGAALLASFGGFSFGYGRFAVRLGCHHSDSDGRPKLCYNRGRPIFGGIGVGTFKWQWVPHFIYPRSPRLHGVDHSWFWRHSASSSEQLEWKSILWEVRFQQALLEREYPDYARHPLLLGIKQWVDLFHPRYLRRTLLAFVIPFFQQVVRDIPVMLYRDRVGRRKLAIYGGIAMAIPHLVMVGTMNWFSSDVSYGPLAWVLTAEVIPSPKRAKGVGAATGMIWLANFSIGVVVPEMLLKLGLGTYLFRGLFCVAATVFSFLFVPETTNKSLEQVAAVFVDGFVDEERNLQSRIAREVWHGSSHARRKRGYERGYRAGWWSGPISERAIHPSERGTTFTSRGILFNLVPAT
ncbi:hypothetical protein AnigIFM60653_009077 [Aspergillus niger]|nr:hypothetical protein AnigIFM60653_009077 [Aspergillus niger]